MKTFASGLATHYGQATTSLAYFLKIQRTDGVVLGLTSCNIPVPVSGVTYAPGFDPSSIVSSSGFAVDNLELTVLKTDEVLTDDDLLAGLWDYAQFTLFECNWMAPADGINLIKRGTTGQATIKLGNWTIEFRSLTQALQQGLGDVTQKTCRYRLGDANCTVDLGPFTVAGAVTSVTSAQIFTDTSQTQADEWFVEGQVKFLTGDNTGYRQKVKIFSAGQFTLSIAMPYPIQVGDTFSAIAGCQKRHDRSLDTPDGVSDCVDKFNNVVNFGGEPHLVGVDVLTANPPTS